MISFQNVLDSRRAPSTRKCNHPATVTVDRSSFSGNEWIEDEAEICILCGANVTGSRLMHEVDKLGKAPVYAEIPF